MSKLESDEIIGFRVEGNRVFMRRPDSYNPRGNHSDKKPDEFEMYRAQLERRVENKEKRGENASVSRQALAALTAG